MAQGVVDLLPDEIVWDRYLSGAYVGTTNTNEAPAGRRCIRFATTTANIGTGTLELLGQTGNATTGTQPVNQRVYRSDGTFYDRLAGVFTYHPTHGHMHFNDWTIFRLRQYLPGGGVGNVIRTGTKTSFCIIETTVYDSSMPGFSNAAWGPYGCGTKQGHRPGRADTYGASLDGQYVDIQGVPDGIYWLEGEVNPNRNVLELNYDNNIARIPISIGNIPAATPDAYEENDTRAVVDARTEGEANSPNLGVINSHRVITNLSVDDADDWYKFRLNNTGTPGDYIRMETPYQSTGLGLSFYLYNSAGALIASVLDTNGLKQITLNGRVAGTYYMRVARQNSNNPFYMLTVEPAGNLPPNITVTSPPAGVMYIEHAYETVPVTWTCNDPEGDPKTVALLVDRVPTVGESNILVTGFENLRGSDLEAQLNNTPLDLGKWYLIARASDGGAYGYGVSQGAFVLYEKGDLNYDGEVDRADLKMYLSAQRGGTSWPADWFKILDLDRNGSVTDADIQAWYRMIKSGGHG
jgi:hypothetical protein